MKARSLYFLAAPGTGLVKIGVATNFAARARQLAHWSPVPLYLLSAIEDCDMAIERAVHFHFQEKWSHFEWFYLDAEIEAFALAARRSTLETLPPPPKCFCLPGQRPRGPRKTLEQRRAQPSAAMLARRNFALARVNNGAL